MYDTFYELVTKVTVLVPLHLMISGPISMYQWESGHAVPVIDLFPYLEHTLVISYEWSCVYNLLACNQGNCTGSTVWTTLPSAKQWESGHAVL